MITIAIAQTHPVFLDPEKNHAAAIRMMRSVKADLYLFPELYLSGYAFSTREEVESCAIDRQSHFFDELKGVSLELGIAVCGGYIERQESGPDSDARAGEDLFYNSAFCIGDGQLLANYRKTHLFYREGHFFTPGDSGFSVFEYKGVKLGIMICYDWIYPESARTLALLGAQVVLHPADLVLPYCQRSMYARAVENRVFIATANRVGRETNSFDDDLTFTGQSQIVSPSGEYLLTFDDTEAGVRTIEIDPSLADTKQLNEFNDLFSDRRPEFYL